ncbi:MAG: hypothetical protein WCT16_00020 [Candidatus Buchananbacteria bacterium]
MPQTTGEAEWLLQALKKDYGRPASKDSSKIKLNQLVSKLGFFYEKIRNAIDYNDEHLIRRNSLRRLINRQMKFLSERDPVKISETVIFEFIRAKYLPNDALPETDIEQTAAIIAKYLMLFKYLQGHPVAETKKVNDWLLDLLTCEIDEYLFPNGRDMAMVNFMYGEMVKSISFVKSTIDEKERNLQIYIAVLKNLLKADLPLIRYWLVKLYNPRWNSFTPDDIKKFAPDLAGVRNRIELHLNHYSGYQITQMIKKQAVFFQILKEIVEQSDDNIRETLNDEKKLEEKINEVCNKNYKRIRSKLIGSIFRVIIYIFFTKTILAFILELPYDEFIIGEVNWQALLINIIFHPLLMFVIAMSIKVPGQKNTQIIIEEIKKIIYGQERKLVYKPRKLLRRGSFTFIFFNTIYLVMFGVSFGVVVAVLHRLRFNLLSGALFIFFLTLVSFFGFRLRNFANQFLVVPRKENLWNFLVDFFSLPIIRAGKFFSTNFSKINIFLYLLDFIIETPFKMLVELLEKALSFIGEKREEIS